MKESILILDFGSQYTQLIARCVRDLQVYCEIHPYNQLPELDGAIKGVILSGSPASVLDADAPALDLRKIRQRYPLLGVCYGAQLIAHQAGGKIVAASGREYGRAKFMPASAQTNEAILFKDLPAGSQVWMSHGDTVATLPENCVALGSTEDVAVAAFALKDEPTYGLQFHPEVTHTVQGKQILQNFLVDVCGCHQTWTPDAFVSQTVASLKDTLGNDKVVMALSGGVDSTVAAVLLHKAIGKNLYCIFVDNGLLRKDEFTQVLETYQNLGLNIRGLDMKEMFYAALKGVSNPEQKRKAIGKTFIDVFEKEAQRIEGVKWLGQGTIYPDVIESVSVKGPSATIKSHHNVGGLPEQMKLRLVEPLRNLFKDEVRRLGSSLQINPDILARHPFPGPGLAIRILGPINPESVAILQAADALFIQALKQSGLYTKIWQAGAILLPVRSVGVMGDERTYERVVALRAVTSFDGMTADWYPLPYDFLRKISNQIINKVKGVNRVVYDVSSKPPATIEWE